MNKTFANQRVQYPGHGCSVGSGRLGFSSDDFLVAGFRSTFRQLVPFNSDKRPTGNGQEVTGNFPWTSGRNPETRNPIGTCWSWSKSTKTVPEPTQIWTDPVIGMIDLGSKSISARKLYVPLTLANSTASKQFQSGRFRMKTISLIVQKRLWRKSDDHDRQ